MASNEDSIRSIPMEMITEILYRLPAKSVGRFRCVSKGWLSLLTEPDFIKTHQKILNHNHLIFQSYNDRSLYLLSFNYHEVLSTPTKIRLELPYQNFTFYGCCNGLVLVSVYNYRFGHTLVVLNPTTRESVELPGCRLEMVDKMLVIDVMYGFGYDSVTDDYKVVTRIYFSSYDPGIPEVHYVSVYTLRTNTWRRLLDYPYNHWHNHWYEWKCLSDAFVNGCLHWAAKKGNDHAPVIVAFSLADEEFSEVPSPNLGDDVDIMCRTYCKLADLGGKLAIFLQFKGELWLMNKYGVRESWTRILLYGLMSLNNFPIIEPMTFDHHGKILLVSHDLMLIYNIENGSFCKLFFTCQNLKDLDVRGMYVESLVSPKVRLTN